MFRIQRLGKPHCESLRLLEPLQQRAVLLDLLDHKVLAVEIHHIQTGERSGRIARFEESALVQVQRKLVLRHLAVGALLLSCHLDVEQGKTVSHFDAHCHGYAVYHLALRLRSDVGVGILYEPLHAALAKDAEVTRYVIKLPDQLDAHQHHFPEGAVASFVQIA